MLALYINSSASELLYRHPQVLWLLCPLLLYWISRVWMIAHRGLMRDDPVVFAATDRTSQVIVLLCAAVAIGGDLTAGGQSWGRYPACQPTGGHAEPARPAA